MSLEIQLRKALTWYLKQLNKLKPVNYMHETDIYCLMLIIVVGMHVISLY